jgi:hypothetical protein
LLPLREGIVAYFAYRRCTLQRNEVLQKAASPQNALLKQLMVMGSNIERATRITQLEAQPLLYNSHTFPIAYFSLLQMNLTPQEWISILNEAQTQQAFSTLASLLKVLPGDVIESWSIIGSRDPIKQCLSEVSLKTEAPQLESWMELDWCFVVFEK